MKRKIIGSIMALLIISTVSIAQRGPRGDQGACYYDGRNITERLDLTEDQQTKIESLRVAHLKATQDQRDQLTEKEVKLASLMNDEAIDQKAVDNLVKEIGDLKTKLMQARVNHKMEVRGLLNDEQKVKFDMMASHRPHHGHRGRF